jgi:chromosome partitioning protein
MIYTIGGIKGGSGKTTIATNLSVFLTSQGREVLLVDADDQESATDFAAIRAESGKSDITAVTLLSKAVYDQIPKLKTKYQDIVIDTGGRDTDTQRYALLMSDVFLVPFIPRSVDIWTLQKVEQLITEAKIPNPALQAYSFLNRADTQGKDNQEAASVLKQSIAFEFLDPIIRNRKAFANAMTSGLGVQEVRPQDEKALLEMTELFQAVLMPVEVL